MTCVSGNFDSVIKRKLNQCICVHAVRRARNTNEDSAFASCREPERLVNRLESSMLLIRNLLRNMARKFYSLPNKSARNPSDSHRIGSLTSPANFMATNPGLSLARAICPLICDLNCIRSIRNRLYYRSRARSGLCNQ